MKELANEQNIERQSKLVSFKLKKQKLFECLIFVFVLKLIDEVLEIELNIEAISKLFEYRIISLWKEMG